MTDTTEKNRIPLLRKADLILVSALLLMGGLALLFVHLLPASSGTVTVTVDGACFGSWPLEENNEILITGPLGTNRLLIADGAASVTEADCPDLICVHHMPVSRAGERIVCLPNRVVIAIEALENTSFTDAVSQ